MKLTSWRERLDPRDRDILERGGYGNRAGLRGKTALAVVDVTYGFTDHDPLPLAESIKRYPSSCGEEAWRAIYVINMILEAARLRGIPIIYSAGKGDTDHTNTWSTKRPITASQPSDAYNIVTEIAPLPHETVFRKSAPSMFFGTPAAEHLRKLEIDSLIVTGGTTSGCVRATVTDAFSHNFLVTVVEDAVFDRAQLSHAISLFDIEHKYGDVIPSTEVLPLINTASEGRIPGEI